MKEIDDLRAEVDTLRDVALLRQKVLADCLAEQRRLKRAFDLAAAERDTWKARYEQLRSTL
jgi:hypothetical protein